MNLIEPFRDSKNILALARLITREAANLRAPLRIMEVCGGHTHSIMRYGLHKILPTNIEFIHGPGCPVCVMPKSRIDCAYALATPKDHILLTLGDMIKVPGSRGSLQKARSEGADVRFVYSPSEALQIAAQNPAKKVIFFAIGFETTTPMTAALIERARESRLKNLFFHINHLLVPPPLEAILGDSGCQINALIAPSHVSAITGAKIYAPLLRHGLPIVVGGFEPLDVLDSVLRILRQKLENRANLEVQYARVVSFAGNLKAQELMQKYFALRENFEWRGLGNIKNSTLRLRDEFSDIDAEVVFAPLLDSLPNLAAEDSRACICGEILRGAKKPTDCKVFGKVCTPQNPIGSCMVSSEGACAAYFRYKDNF